MQIVIDIDDEDYERIQDISDVFNSLTSRTYSAIRKGTPLDKIRERINLEKLGYPPSAGYYKAIVKVLQIIDKYKAESEDKE